MADRPLPGYDTSFGNKKAWVGDHFGPASYVTGGETFSARQLGWGGFDMIAAMAITFSRTYLVEVIYPAAGVGSLAYITLKWYVESTGVEVGLGVDLSAEKVRLLAIGV